jgi:hypothetical protein
MLFEQDGVRSERFILGQSFGRFSVEGTGTRYGLGYVNTATGWDGTSLAIAGKLDLPLGNNFSVFGRAGLQRTWLSAQRDTMRSFDGDGWLLGAGFAYHFDAALLGGGAIFVDYNRDKSTFTGAGNKPFDATASMWTLGLTLTL